MPKKITTEEFIIRAQKLHGNKYDYQASVYTGIFNKIKIKCNICDNTFEQIAHNHLNGEGCPYCKNNLNSKRCRYTKDIFIEKAKSIHGNKYNYDKINYINSRIPIKIFCNKCKKYFMQIPSSHLQGNGCFVCAHLNIGKKSRSNLEHFIKKAQIIHNKLYNYSKVKYIRNFNKVKIFCNTCKKYFYQTPQTHLAGCGCPYCKMSHGENKIMQYLDKNNITYNKQKVFKKCKYKRSLPFDFYLPDYNTCIEYQGGQHYEKFRFEKDDLNLKQRKLRDKIKKNFCKENNILLLEIKYNDKIEEKLNAFFNNYKHNEGDK